MQKSRPRSTDPSSLRSEAEQRVAKRRARWPREATDSEVRRALHELDVHQVELEMQNEELRKTRDELERGLERYAELFDFAPVGYAALDSDSSIRELNLAGAAILGAPRSELVGNSFAGFVPHAERLSFTSLLAKALDGESEATLELGLVIGEAGAKPAKPVRREVRLRATRLAHSGRRVLVAFEDVTERKAREEELRRVEAALREAVRRKDEFLATLSHELRNPLAPIRNSLFVLKRAQPGGEQARRSQAIIDRQVSHLARLVDDLLDVTRITRGKIELKREHVDLGELVRRTLEDHRASFEASGLLLDGRLEAGPLWLDADPARVVQIVSNVLGNAEKFTSRGGTVAVSLAREADMAVLSVRDSGVGIAPELLPHVYEPFTQAQQTMDRTRGGLGLGLAMVKGLVELHAGRVAILSEGPGRGTELVIRLPLARGLVEMPPRAEPPPARSRRILVIEDHPDAAESLKEALELGGHEVEIAFDGPDGLERARAFRPEIVLCDLGLPDMDGYAVARAFRADSALRGAHLIALSGYAQPEDLQRSRRAGFHRHIAKPPNLEELSRLLAEVPVPESSGASKA